MNVNEYKDTYILVIKALQKAKIHDTTDGYTRLYITKQNGLAGVSLSDLERIIRALHKEHFITLNHIPIESELIADNTPHYHDSEDEKELREKKLLNFYPRPVFPINYFSLTLEDKFEQAAAELGAPLFLLAKLPSGKRSNPYKLAELLIQEQKVPNSTIVAKIRFKSEGYRKTITSKEYLRSRDSNKRFYNDRIENCIRTLRRHFRPHGYDIKCKTDYTELVKTTPAISTRSLI